MPTGYTAKLAEGDVPFHDFVWGCARAMGALMMMRDEPRGAPIGRAKVVPYYAEKLAEAQEQAVSARAWSDADADRLAVEANAAALAYVETERAKVAALSARYESMRARVLAWKPPTPEHENFRGFMLDQLEKSQRCDCYFPASPKLHTGESFRAEKLQMADYEIAHYTRELARDTKRVAEANAWIDALRESVGDPS